MFKSRYRFIIFFTIIVILLSFSGGSSLEAQQNDELVSVAKKFIKQANIASDKLHLRPRSERKEQEYLAIIELYRQALDADKEHLCGDQALMAMAELSEEIASYLRKFRYYYNAVEYYKQLAKTYPNSPHHARALVRLAKVLEQPPFDPQSAITAYSEVIKHFPNSLSAREAKANIVRLTEYLEKPSLVDEGVLERQITGIRSFTGLDYARIVIDLSAPVTYEKTLMSSSSLVLQVHEAKLLPKLLEQDLALDTEGLLKGLNFEESTKGVRFNLKFDKIRDYAVFTINNPDRLMIDLKGKNSETLETAANKIPTSDLQTDNSLTSLNSFIHKQNEKKLSLMRALGLKVKKIVIDAGHGGHDVGALGPNGLQEKDLVLDVALRLRDIIKQQLPEIEVVMTRDKDTFISLEERTAIANAQSADLFLSIHANSGQSLDASGVETYYLSINANKEELEVAARENSSTTRNARDLQSLLQRIVLEDKVLESRGFAQIIQGKLVTGLGKINQSAGVDRGVKKAPFIVLIGANMPSVLSEISFVSNPEQAKLLQTKEFRQQIANSLFSGVYNYVEVLQHGNNIVSAKK
ncbi:MAG: N-acetylmuramoyl-L-alanine amidase [Acidobacteria bacterium]|nr:N-acetylmuramoyl-L-alanine amidase [Acidobacteriota bacterium]